MASSPVSLQGIGSLAGAGLSTSLGILGALQATTAIGLASGIGAAVAGMIAITVGLMKIFSGCGQNCILTSDDANKVGNYLTQQLTAYMGSPVHYKSMQTAYLNTFDTAWQALMNACSNPQFGSAGQRCITDRQQGSCAYHVSAGGWQQNNGVWQWVSYGANNSGTTCWNWFVGYRDPVANDPTVVPDPTSQTDINPTASGGQPIATNPETGATGQAQIPGFGAIDLNDPVTATVAALAVLFGLILITRRRRAA